ncbi:MAG: phytoene desaturase family protein [Acidobacteriota bacterium]
MAVSHALVIGAGFGGLAAALRLRARGYEVTIIDRQDQAGGRAGVYRRDGYTFDAGPTIITAPFLLDELFGLFGHQTSDYVSLQALEPWYRIRFDGGETFDYSGHLDTMLDEIGRFEPRDSAGYRSLLNQTESIYREGFERLGDQPFHQLQTMLKAAPKLARLRSDRSVYRQTASFIRHPLLRQALSFHPLLVGGNPFTTTSVYSLIHYLERVGGVHFVMGGTAALVDGLVRLLQEQGVVLRLGQSVKEIVAEGPEGGGRRARARGVRLESGEMLEADVVVANADAPFVYRHLVRPEHRSKWSDRRIGRQRYSMGLFVLYFGSRRTYPHLAHHEILLGPRYRGLIDDIFERRVLAEDMSLYLHAPTRTDPSLAPPGCESMYALVPVPNLQAGIDWADAAPRLRDRLVARLSETVCPDLSNDITADFYVTPQHFEDRLLSMHGAGFSIQPTLTQSAYFRYHNRSEELRDLYLVGAGTHPGAGVPGVLSSAKVLDRLLDEERETLARQRSISIPAAPADRVDRQSPDVRSAARLLGEGAGGPAAALMSRRAKTFSFATALLPRAVRADVATLYRFCRVVDDLADDVEDPRVGRLWLDRVYGDLERGSSTLEPVAAFLDLAQRRSIPTEFARELVRGLRTDLGLVRFESRDDLVRYCYQVASTVGVMMCRVLRTEASDAVLYAVDLGIAMQLTNIARDVAEDFAADRIYLPRSWVDAGAVERGIRGEAEGSEQLFGAVERVLDLAADYYRSSDLGIPLLPAGARWGILTASRSYEAIGSGIRAAGTGYWRRRVYTSKRRKAWEAVRSLATLATGGLQTDQSSRRHKEHLHRPLNALPSATLWLGGRNGFSESPARAMR